MSDSYASPRGESGQAADSGDIYLNMPATADSNSSPSTLPVDSVSASRRLTWLFVGVTLLLLLCMFAPFFVEQLFYASTRGKLRAEMESAAEGLESLRLDQLSKAFQFVSQRVAPSVVNINVASGLITGPDDEFSELFGHRDEEFSDGQGSGVIVEADGHILTNSHVVKNATRIEVSLADGRVLPAKAVGVDSLTDLALIKIDADKLLPIEWGDSNRVEAGALVWAVGSPFGLEQSITAGILSGKNRSGKAGTVYYDFLQTDAAVNPGNSGGPLVDARGRVIGINTAIVGQMFQGISFAIPSNEARKVYQELRTHGRVERGWLGVSLADVTPSVAKQLGFSGSLGAIVVGISRDSPAQEAGIRPSDIILKWNGVEIPDSTTLSRSVARTKVGTTVEIELWRNGSPQTLKVTVTERPVTLG